MTMQSALRTESPHRPIGYGLIGAGAFGTFCIGHYRQSPLIEVRAVADENVALARQTAATVGVEACASVDELLARPDVEIVHLATPPFTHRELVLKALRAGKHVLCEKPLATSVADAQEMLAAARAAGRVLVVNLIMRYDPLNVSVARLLHDRLLGEPIAISLTNLAGDWKLFPAHWFWDPAKSGGIFIEHGVHFFDLFAMFLGDGTTDDRGTVLSAAEGRRPGDERIVEQVTCTLRHGNGVLATHYHGFHQPGLLDRQELRIVCERGDIRCHDWLTTRVTVDSVQDVATTPKIVGSFDHASITKRESLAGDKREILARHKRFVADERVQIEATLGMEKQELYAVAIRELLEDQVRFIRDPSHARRVTEANGLSSLMIAEAARGAVVCGDD